MTSSRFAERGAGGSTRRTVDDSIAKGPGPGKITRSGGLTPAQGQAPAGGGRALPSPVRAKMERAFNADFSAVRIHEDDRASQLGAQAFAQGNDIHFAPGQYDPESEQGQTLLGHELSHIVQQRAGRVAVPQGRGMAVNADQGLEAEADAHGAKAARGESIAIAGAASASTARAAIQAKAMRGPGWGWLSWTEGGEAAWQVISQHYDLSFTPLVHALADRPKDYPFNAQQRSDLAEVIEAGRWDNEEIPYTDGLKLARQLLGLIARAQSLVDLIQLAKPKGGEPAMPPDFHVGHHTKTLDQVASFVGAKDAHAEGVTGKGVHVAIIDSGWYAHPYFQEKYPEAQIEVVQLAVPKYEGDPNPKRPDGDKRDDLNGHGTAMVANVLAMAPDARITMIVCPSDMFALKYAHTLRPDVISVSRGPTWGEGKSANNDPRTRSGMLDDYREILDQGRADNERPPIVLDAVGNRGARGMLSMLPGVISVGGIHADEDGGLAASSYTNAYKTDGAYMSKHARGKGGSDDSIVKPVVPDLAALCGAEGQDNYLQLPAQHGADLEHDKHPGWGLASGSSCATPQVAGVVALLRQVNPALRTDEAIDILKRTATPVSEGKGHGADGLRADEGDWSRLINAKAAVEEARRRL